MIEVRSYRRVFDLERRVYSVDGVRLNPTGIPLRGIVYFLLLVWAAVTLSALAGVGQLISRVPWYIRDLALPGLSAMTLAAIRIEGRVFHLALLAAMRLLVGPRRLIGLDRRSPVGQRWLPASMLMLPDGSEARPRRLLYRGPGAVLVRFEHRRSGALERGGVGLASGAARIRVEATAARVQDGDGEVILLGAGARLLVLPRSQAPEAR